jgi:hypothetical protein
VTDNYNNKIDKDIEFLSSNPKNIKFDELFNICKKYFGKPRNSGSSHFIFKTPWPGDPRINLQRDKKNKKMAKVYQVRDVISSLEKIKTI